MREWKHWSIPLSPPLALSARALGLQHACLFWAPPFLLQMLSKCLVHIPFSLKVRHRLSPYDLETHPIPHVKFSLPSQAMLSSSRQPSRISTCRCPASQELRRTENKRGRWGCHLQAPATSKPHCTTWGRGRFWRLERARGQSSTLSSQEPSTEEQFWPQGTSLG